MIRKGIILLLLASGAIVTTFPFVWMIGTAFKTMSEASSSTLSLFPEVWQWQNPRQTFEEAPFKIYFYNSFVVAFSVTAAVVVTSILAGYAFARLRFPGRQVVFGIILATMMIPFEVTLIPNFLLIRSLDLYNSYGALIIPWCANAFSIFLVRQSFMSLPGDYYDAATVDGCGHLRFLTWIATPLIKPTAVTVALFAFLSSYNALMWPIVVTSDRDMRVVQYGLTVFFGEAGVKVNLLMCAAAIVILPTVALYFAAQKYFLESSLSAGIKG
ncbi:MAG: carbohydrate ABC transporter permease [Candidatus Hydrogenedentes bacterium]|nr:carbohydrate ABC transporter permease [Candidatus Hydrogenedentota bacterium]